MNETLEILPLIVEAGAVVKAVMGVLLLMSALGWLFIFRLSAKLSGALRDDDAFAAWFFEHKNLNQKYQKVANDDDRVGLAEVFFVGFDEYLRLAQAQAKKDEISDVVERKLRAALGQRQIYLEDGLPLLASVASVAPYIGLFGTVWGIMSAFIGISQAQSVGLATVAPGIAEALIATAMGLFAAIPASLAFNHFSAKAAKLYERRAAFCDELLADILALRAQKRQP